jgi:hypothetical protein
MLVAVAVELFKVERLALVVQVGVEQLELLAEITLVIQVQQILAVVAVVHHTKVLLEWQVAQAVAV